MKNKDNKKMNIYEYESHYIKAENIDTLKIALRFVIGIFAIIVVYIMVSICYKLFLINKILGYVSIIASIFIFIYCFIVPLFKLFSHSFFKTNVTRSTAKLAKVHNEKVINEMAHSIIDFNSQVGNANWYDDEIVEHMKLYIGHKDENSKNEIRDDLSILVNGSIRKMSNSIIVKSSVKAGGLAAAVPSSSVDFILVGGVNIQMIKDLIFLYGFRPSSPKLAKIIFHIFINSLLAYGFNGINVSSGIMKTFGSAFKGVPLIGQAIGYVIDTGVQGLADGAITAFVGYRTIAYLNEEYNLQNILNDIDLLDDEKEFEETLNEVKHGLKDKESAKTE